MKERTGVKQCERQILGRAPSTCPDNWHKVTTIQINIPTFDEISFIQVRAATMSWGHKDKDTVVVGVNAGLLQGNKLYIARVDLLKCPLVGWGILYIQGHAVALTLVGRDSDIPFCSHFEQISHLLALLYY